MSRFPFRLPNRTCADTAAKEVKSHPELDADGDLLVERTEHHVLFIGIHQFTMDLS